MGSPLKPPDDNAPIRVTRVKDARHAGHMTCAATNGAMPKLIPDHLTLPLGERARNADGRLDRTVRRLVRPQVMRDPPDPDGPRR